MLQFQLNSTTFVSRSIQKNCFRVHFYTHHSKFFFCFVSLFVSNNWYRSSLANGFRFVHGGSFLMRLQNDWKHWKPWEFEELITFSWATNNAPPPTLTVVEKFGHDLDKIVHGFIIYQQDFVGLPDFFHFKRSITSYCQLYFFTFGNFVIQVV